MHIISFKEEKSNYSKCFIFASFALLHLSFNSNSGSFVEGGRKYILAPGREGTLATPLRTRVGKLVNISCF